ncbi:hypothetical protein [Acidisphaera rubrifaciens]|uniref:Uncharacterized protein n=1 Tax=Acidisphaera rubrifaciens HS-AP3 TaxID=1231350 RepID=A0A0D6P8I7_9PROT|nr:hypothetical protein [Acidisphaera rubrifaciens]GAN78095.1 hypothetical protein Asru_0617_04 [Acidisphaera rubrifaciens HS-AP3]
MDHHTTPKRKPHPRSVEAFCQRWGFCRATFYNQAKLGLMPDVIRVGSRVVISEAAEAAWAERSTKRSAA